MKWFSLLSAACYALSVGQASAAKCNADNCARAVTGTKMGLATASAHKADCSSFLLCTVMPSSATPTTFSTAAVGTNGIRVRRAGDLGHRLYERQGNAAVGPTGPTGPTGTAPAATTVCPTAVPSYASACSGSSRFSSACSCAGVTKMFTTVSMGTMR